MRAFTGTICFIVAFLATTVCWAATIEPGQGDLSINQGQGYQRVDGRINANAGDVVMVSPGGSATVSYADGCQVNVQPGSVMAIAPLSPCASGSMAQIPDSGFGGAGALTMGVLFAGGVAAGVVGYLNAKTTGPTSP